MHGARSCLVSLTFGPGEGDAGEEGAAGEGDAEEFLVADVGEVVGADVGADEAAGAGERERPKRVGGAGDLLDDGDLGAQGELGAGGDGLVGEARVVAGVVEGVLGDETGEGGWRVQEGLAEVDLLAWGEVQGCGRLDAGVGDFADVGGLPGRGEDVF